MSTTLARKIRRIGMMPTTFTERRVGEHLSHDVNGNPVILPIIKTERHENYDQAALRDKESIAASITAEWRKARKARKSR
jgi:hypothetical protein